jgi:hypothetical protein
MDLVLKQWQCTPGIPELPLIDEGRTLLNPTCNRQQQPPNYQCNADPDTIEVLPTMVSFPGSNNYKEDRTGMLWDNTLQAAVEPNANERERLLG